MVKLIKLQNQKKKLKGLQKYVDLVEPYDTHNLEKWIIKEYVCTNSIKKVIKSLNDNNLTYSGAPVNKKYVTSLVNGKASGRLHNISRSGYRNKVKLNETKNSDGSIIRVFCFIIHLTILKP
ncbi:hypothetical protein AB9M92_25905 [Peribacillus frigoritolerans]|uniref:hypothetical protein n=1 Tax=Peribacillus frigoritolerans TaxID=450367 RepID=UPI0035168808